MWELRETIEFEDNFAKLSPDIKERFENQIKKLRNNPYALGKPLGYPWFRELKNEKFRVYYLIYDQLIVILFVAVSDKKTQQEAINIIKGNLKMFKEFVEKGAKVLKEKEALYHKMNEDLQELIDERQKLIHKLCMEIIAIEDETIKIPVQ